MLGVYGSWQLSVIVSHRMNKVSLGGIWEGHHARVAGGRTGGPTSKEFLIWGVWGDFRLACWADHANRRPFPLRDTYAMPIAEVLLYNVFAQQSCL